METSSSRYALCESADVTRVDMPADLLAAINALPDRKPTTAKGYPWTPEQDEALLAGWGKKPMPLVAKVIGVGIKTARKRYRELTGA